MINNAILNAKGWLVVHKKQLLIGALLVALLGGAGAGAKELFQVKGIVTAVTGSQVTVASFFRTQTVDLSQAPVNLAAIRVGDQIKLQKNLHGDIISSRIKENESDHRERLRDDLRLTHRDEHRGGQQRNSSQPTDADSFPAQ